MVQTKRPDSPPRWWRSAREHPWTSVSQHATWTAAAHGCIHLTDGYACPPLYEPALPGLAQEARA
jgi:hypothetical protein